MMGTCTSTRRDFREEKRGKKSVVIENPNLTPIFPSIAVANLDFQPIPTNSLIQFYSVNQNNNNNSLSPRFPPAAPIHLKTGFLGSMSMLNQRTMPNSTRSGCIRPPLVPGLEHARAAALAVRSRSISPSSSTLTGKTSSSSTILGQNRKSPTTNKTDVNTVRNRYRVQKRMNFFVRRPSTTNPLKSPSIEPNEDSAYASFASPNTDRFLSSSSALSEVFNQETLLHDENCSLKSDDLLCPNDETLTLDSSSRKDRTESCSSSTSSHPSLRKTHGNLRESLDELTRLTHRVDPNLDNEQQRKTLSRSVSLKPPSSTLPPLEDAEHLMIDIESYRQLMKDVTVIKTILHQLDRLLKQTDGCSMTDSMIGSFHESVRRSSTENNSIEDNGKYDELLKEIFILRKEREQDKQTIKLLQEQMYKYSRQNTTNSNND